MLDYMYVYVYNVIKSKVTKQFFIGGIEMDLIKIRKYSNEVHGVNYITTLLEEAGDCVTNPEEIEIYDYLADKIMAEYKYVLDILTHSETERFHIGGKRR